MMRNLLNLLFFGIPLLYYYINLNWSIIGDDSSLRGFSKVFFDAILILSANLLPTKSLVASAVF